MWSRNRTIVLSQANTRAGVTYSSIERMLSMDAPERACVAALIIVGQETPSGLTDWTAAGLGRVSMPEQHSCRYICCN